MFKIFILSVLTQFSDFFQSSPWQTCHCSVVRLSEFYLTHAHTQTHSCEDTVCISWYTSLERNAKEDFFFSLYCYLFIYFKLGGIVGIVSIVCNVHFIQNYYLYAFSFFFFFLLRSIFHGLVQSMIKLYILLQMFVCFLGVRKQVFAICHGNHWMYKMALIPNLSLNLYSWSESPGSHPEHQLPECTLGSVMHVLASSQPCLN